MVATKFNSMVSRATVVTMASLIVAAVLCISVWSNRSFPVSRLSDQFTTKFYDYDNTDLTLQPEFMSDKDKSSGLVIDVPKSPWRKELIGRWSNNEPVVNKRLLELLSGLKHGTVVVDAGCNVGDTGLKLATKLKSIGSGARFVGRGNHL